MVCKTGYPSDSDDEREAGPVVLVGGPAYNLGGWEVGSGGPQCSQTDEYCYFCAFHVDEEEDAKDGATSDVKALWNDVESQIQQQKELHVIVESVYALYKKNIQPHVKYQHPATHAIITKPGWSRESIRRHLLFGATWPELFDAGVTSMFQSIIYNQNNHVMDTNTNMVIEERRTALLDTIRHFTHWQTRKTATNRRHAGKTMRCK